MLRPSGLPLTEIITVPPPPAALENGKKAYRRELCANLPLGVLAAMTGWSFSSGVLACEQEMIYPELTSLLFLAVVLLSRPPRQPLPSTPTPVVMPWIST